MSSAPCLLGSWTSMHSCAADWFLPNLNVANFNDLNFPLHPCNVATFFCNTSTASGFRRLRHCDLSEEPAEDARSCCTYSGDKASRQSIAPCRRCAPIGSHLLVIGRRRHGMAWRPAALASAPRSRANGEEYPRLVRDPDR